MLHFTPLAPEDAGKLRLYFEFADNRICDNTPGTAVMWRDYFSTCYAIFNSTMICKLRGTDGITAFSMPLGKDINGAFSAIEDYCCNKNIPVVFCAVTEKEIPVLKSRYNIDVRCEDDWGDYLYNADDLSNMAGKKYSGQRNHINYFNSINSGWRFEEITTSNVACVRDFYEDMGLSVRKDSQMFLEEQRKIIEVFEKYDLYGMKGGFISLADGKIVAMAIGETVGDTLFVHIEKALADVRGAYQLIAREFPRHFCTDGVKFVNREEDLGEEGLRKSKLSYHPCEIIKKYTVIVK